MLLLLFFFSSMLLLTLLWALFSFLGKATNWSSEGSSGFECGFTPYFFSHHSFSTHYYLVGVIFLFLDLELCLLMPFFNTDFMSVKSALMLFVFITILVLGIFLEWASNKLEWKF